MAQPEHITKTPPERRLALRVPVRRLVRAAIGLRSFEALLVDLSITACQLQFHPLRLRRLNETHRLPTGRR